MLGLCIFAGLRDQEPKQDDVEKDFHERVDTRGDTHETVEGLTSRVSYISVVLFPEVEIEDDVEHKICCQKANHDREKGDNLHAQSPKSLRLALDQDQKEHEEDHVDNEDGRVANALDHFEALKGSLHKARYFLGRGLRIQNDCQDIEGDEERVGAAD